MKQVIFSQKNKIIKKLYFILNFSNFGCVKNNFSIQSKTHQNRAFKNISVLGEIIFRGDTYLSDNDWIIIPSLSADEIVPPFAVRKVALMDGVKFDEALNVDNLRQHQDIAVTVLLPLKVSIGQVVNDNFILNIEQLIDLL